MEIAKNFQHQAAEAKWYQHWQDKGYFHSEPDSRKPPYTIVMPPPNVTGVLHMGHALNNSVQDVLIRRAKAKGFNTCWVPGTDHASIATEAKVVGMLRERGIDKKTLSRDEFLKYAWEWKEKYGGIILQQLKKLGCALDWQRTHFTMDEGYYKAVISVFVALYNKGYIYRGVKMINWDPKAKTALSDEEVIFKQTRSKLYYVAYPLTDGSGNITIATVRPETILGDTAVCVHPDDERYRNLIGKECYVPLINRPIPIIADTYIDPEFGTGALKVTPAHDINDYNLGQKHQLPVIDTLNEDGTMSPAAQLYVGEDRFVVRQKIVEELRLKGYLVKEEDYTNQVGHSERSDAVIEPRLSMQWWCRMEDLAQPALAAVEENEIAFYPAKYKNLYRHWMENIRDWCISRQLWWGQRIPAWYDNKGNIYVAENEEKAREQFFRKNPNATVVSLRQEEDVLDTWFSSWLWPMEVFNWNEKPDNQDLNYYYPTTTLVTAPEIIFFWVARMIMAGYEFTGKKPFEQVYFTGIVRDKQGRKMSKSLGNSPDLLALIDEWGADAVRFSVMISSPAGNDLLYDEASLEQGRNFGNKMWNAARLIGMWKDKVDPSLSYEKSFPEQWMEQRIIAARAELDNLFATFRLSEALKLIYSLIWDDFCSWYLEWMKPGMEESMSEGAYQNSIRIYEQLLQLLHPFLPYITEELYHNLKERAAGDDLMVLPLPETAAANEVILREADKLQQLITLIRDARARQNIKPKEKISLQFSSEDNSFYERHKVLLLRQVNADKLEAAREGKSGSMALVAGTDKLWLESHAEIDRDAQREQLEKELAYQRGFLNSVMKKLSNERFVQNAKPEVVNAEQKKKEDAEAKIKTLEESLALL